jgi:hypothetical protein
MVSGLECFTGFKMLKKINYILFVVLLFAGFSCRKDIPLNINQQVQNNPPLQPTETVYDYFYKYNAEFVNDYMPQHHIEYSGCPGIISLEGNSYVIPGGPNKLAVSFTDNEHDVTELFYGVKGVFGYYKIEVPQNARDAASLVVIISQVIKRANFIIEICLRDARGNISEPFYLPVELVTADPGKLQVSLSFDQPNDLDLHLKEPGGFEIYYQHPVSPSGGYLDLDANAACHFDSTNNENIIYKDSVPLGVYKVRVVYYMQCVPWMNTNYSVTALYNGQLITPILGSNPYIGVFNTGTYAGTAVNVMSFENNSSSKIAHLLFAAGTIPNRPTKVKNSDALK